MSSSSNEIELLLDASKDTSQRIAFGLGARCGLRSHETTAVRPVDIIDGPAGSMIKVERGKGEKYRETPLPSELETTIQVYSEQRDAPIDQPLVDVSTRAFREWTKQAADRCRSSTGEDRWRHFTTHDLRRTWETFSLRRTSSTVKSGIGADRTTGKPSAKTI